MSLLKDLLIGIAAILALVLGVLGINQPSNDRPVGSVTGPDASFNCETHNGVQTCFARTKMLQATTTPCALRSPAATSTLVLGTAAFSFSSTSAQTVYLAKATTPFATTTSLGSGALGAGAFGTFVASTSPALSSPLDPSQVFAPNTYFVVATFGGQSGGTNPAALNVPTGFCNAKFEVVL